jgi:hypothetical protein
MNREMPPRTEEHKRRHAEAMKISNIINEKNKMNIINNFLKKYMKVSRHKYNNGDEMVHSRCHPVICNDGFQMSVQAGEQLYSSPRSYIAEGSYTEAEVGFPSEREPLIDEYVERYSEEDLDYTQRVYPYVPCDVIDAVIEKHGGINEAAVIDSILAEDQEGDAAIIRSKDNA